MLGINSTTIILTKITIRAIILGVSKKQKLTKTVLGHG